MVIEPLDDLSWALAKMDDLEAVIHASYQSVMLSLRIRVPFHSPCPTTNVYFRVLYGTLRVTSVKQANF